MTLICRFSNPPPLHVKLLGLNWCEMNMKVSFEALSYHLTKSFTYNSIKKSVSKSKKSLCHTLLTTTRTPECHSHILFEWPLKKHLIQKYQFKWENMSTFIKRWEAFDKTLEKGFVRTWLIPISFVFISWKSTEKFYSTNLYVYHSRNKFFLN